MISCRYPNGTQARDVGVAEAFVAQLRGRCDGLAELPGTLGQAQEDLASGRRSLAWRRYLILFRYVGDRVEIARLLHGMRDIAAILDHDDES
jgi:toxin ParE1/3/4